MDRSGPMIKIKKAIFKGGVNLYALREKGHVADQYSLLLLIGGHRNSLALVVDEFLKNGCDVVSSGLHSYTLSNPRNSQISFSHRTGNICINTDIFYKLVGIKGRLS